MLSSVHVHVVYNGSGMYVLDYSQVYFKGVTFKHFVASLEVYVLAVVTIVWVSRSY